tara:strand:+ start:218 stop:643 length:426 start_codon:yes stop_codon:yes gene_type:complete
MKLVSLTRKASVGRLSRGKEGVSKVGRSLQARVSFFDASNDLAVVVRCKKSGRFGGRAGNDTSVVLSRLSENRYAMQVYFRKIQINGNMISTGGINGVVNKFNTDADVNADFIAIKKKEVDSAFTGTGAENASPLRGGRGR